MILLYYMRLGVCIQLLQGDALDADGLVVMPPGVELIITIMIITTITITIMISTIHVINYKDDTTTTTNGDTTTTTTTNDNNNNNITY